MNTWWDVEVTLDLGSEAVTDDSVGELMDTLAHLYSTVGASLDGYIAIKVTLEAGGALAAAEAASKAAVSAVGSLGIETAVRELGVKPGKEWPSTGVR
ncbi:hypothetical protein [Streptomyces sp. NPDC059278]|uniref:hypothetical protein n=1 Tax=Streptomyces sp. NPDC059278 TaxID=3346801 RepID=UPI00368A6C1D